MLTLSVAIVQYRCFVRIIHVRGACEFLLFLRRLLRPTMLRHTADTYVRAYVLMVGLDYMHVYTM